MLYGFEIHFAGLNKTDSRICIGLYQNERKHFMKLKGTGKYALLAIVSVAVVYFYNQHKSQYDF